MALLTITLWKTRVVNNIVQGPSELVTITINDNDPENGLIDPKEWTAAIGGVLGHNAGDESPGSLWRGDITGNKTAGYLFNNIEYSGGENVKPIMDGLKQNFDPVPPDAVSVCFLAGTRIATPSGPVAVEDLRPGDLVLTRDAGPQPVLWVSADHVDAARLDRCPNLRPVKFARGALGPDCPHRSVMVSAQHRVMIRDDEGAEVLAAARHLAEAGMPGVRVIQRPAPFTLVHLALADHHILLAEGAPMESFFPGPMALHALRPADRARLIAVFPDLAQGRNPMQPARPFLTRRQTALVLATARHGNEKLDA